MVAASGGGELWGGGPVAARTRSQSLMSNTKTVSLYRKQSLGKFAVRCAVEHCAMPT